MLCLSFHDFEAYGSVSDLWFRFRPMVLFQICQNHAGQVAGQVARRGTENKNTKKDHYSDIFM